MKRFFLSVLLFQCTTAFCQDKSGPDNVVSLFKVTVLNPGFSYEQRLGKFQTLYLQAFMNASASKTTSFGGITEYRFYIDPAVTAQYRYYYNFGRRSDKGLRTDMNNLNYLSPVYQLFFSKVPLTGTLFPDKRRPVHFIAAVWGIQRNYNKAHFSLDLNIGPGVLMANTNSYDVFNNVYTNIHQSEFSIYSQLNIGFWFGK